MKRKKEGGTRRKYLKNMKRNRLLILIWMLCIFILIYPFIIGFASTWGGSFTDSSYTSNYYDLSGSTGNYFTLWCNFTSIRFNDIDYYDTILYIKVRVEASGSEGRGVYMDSEAPMGAQTSFSSSVGNGYITYSKIGSYYDIYLFFNTFDRDALTDQQDIELTYNRNELYNFRYYNGNGGQSAYKPHLPSVNEVGFLYDELTPYCIRNDDISNQYQISYGTVFRNDYNIILENELYNISITRNISNKVYISSWNVSSVSVTFFNETLGTSDINFIVNEIPLYFYCWDSYGNYYIAIYEGQEEGAKKLYGIVMDVKDNFVLPDVYLTFNEKSRYSTSSGIYNFYDSSSGYYNLIAILSNYQSFNEEINYTSSSDVLKNVYMIKNETVYDNTTTLCGIIFNNQTKEPLQNVLIKLDSNKTYSNINGYYVFYNQSEGIKTISFEKSGFFKNQTSITLILNNVTYLNIYLEPVTILPSPSPTPEEITPEKALKSTFTLVGIPEQYLGLFFALILITFCGVITAKISKFNPMMSGVGIFIGFILSIVFGLIPEWILWVIVALGILIIAKLFIPQE